MNNDFSNDVYVVEQIMEISPAIEAAMKRVRDVFNEQVAPIARMYGVNLSEFHANLMATQWRRVTENPTHKWAVKMFQTGKKPAILGFDTACSYTDAVSNLDRIASRYPVTYDQANRRYVGDGFFIAIEVKEIANENNPASHAHKNRS